MNTGSLIAFILLLAVSSGCTRQETIYAAIGRLNHTDSFVRYAPPGLKPAIRRFYEQSLGLDSLVNGTDGVKIRFWFSCALGKENLLECTLNGEKWSARIADLWREKRSGTERYDSIGFRYRTAAPASGWPSFSDQLAALHLFELPDMDSIPGFAEKANIAVADGCGFSVEIATPKTYRSIAYPNHDLYMDAFEECGQIDKLWELIEKEFGFDYKPRWRFQWPRPEEERDLKDVKLQEVKIETNEKTVHDPSRMQTLRKKHRTT